MQTQPQGHDIRRLASMARGAGCRGNYPPPVEGEKCSLTSPFIEQAIAQVCAVCSLSSAALGAAGHFLLPDPRRLDGPAEKLRRGTQAPAPTAGALPSFVLLDRSSRFDGSDQIPAFSINPGIPRAMVKAWRAIPTHNSLWNVVISEGDSVKVGRTGEDEALAAGHTSPARCAIFFLSGCVFHYRVPPCAISARNRCTDRCRNGCIYGCINHCQSATLHPNRGTYAEGNWLIPSNRSEAS